MRRRGWSRAAALLVLLLPLGIASSCRNAGTVSLKCDPAEQVVCPCPDGTAGYRVCTEDGRWSDCVCDGDGGPVDARPLDGTTLDGTTPDAGRVDAGDPCQGVTCSGHGSCEVTGGQAECVCEPGYHAQGLDCVKDSDPCDGVSCSGHGVCQVTGGQAECVCEPGYHPEGLDCVADDPCSGVSCSGHGTCRVTGGQAECDCEAGYHAQGLSCVPDSTNCPSTLADRISVSTVSVAPDTINPSAGGYFSPLTPPILEPLPSGAKVAWVDTSGLVHVTPLDGSDARAGQDVTVPANEIIGFAAHTNGFAVLVQRSSDEMGFCGFNSAGQQVFDLTIVGNVDHDATGSKWIRRDWSHYGRVAFADGTYAVYFGHVQNWGS